MIRKIRYFVLPALLVEEQKQNPLTRDLWLAETGEIRVSEGAVWAPGFPDDKHRLIYCTLGRGIIRHQGNQISLSADQFIIIPQHTEITFQSGPGTPSTLLIACFNGRKATYFAHEFMMVRSTLSSVSHRIANREMLFDEIFNNLSKGFHDENLEYIHFCFGHLLATFVLAYRTSDDPVYETNPGVMHAIDYLGKSLNKKLTLKQIADEVGYSPTYFTTLFRKTTGYSPISYFSHLKILKACEFLDYTNNKIKEISFALGYTDPYYFSRDFSKKIGLSPRQYRYRADYRWTKPDKKI